MALPWKRLGAAALVAGLAALPAAWALDRLAGREVLVVAASDEASVEINRGLWELNGGPRAEVPSIYGTPTGAPVRVVFAGEGRVVSPAEDPSLSLYLKRGADHPLQTRTLYYAGSIAAAGGVLLGVLLLLLGRRRGKAA